MKKYVCIGNETTEAEWLQRWYKIPHDECVFFSSQNDWANLLKNAPSMETIILRPLPKGTDYEQYLKTLKTERLLDGTRIHE